MLSTRISFFLIVSVLFSASFPSRSNAFDNSSENDLKIFFGRNSNLLSLGAEYSIENFKRIKDARVKFFFTEDKEIRPRNPRKTSKIKNLYFQDGKILNYRPSANGSELEEIRRPNGKKDKPFCELSSLEKSDLIAALAERRPYQIIEVVYVTEDNKKEQEANTGKFKFIKGKVDIPYLLLRIQQQDPVTGAGIANFYLRCTRFGVGNSTLKNQLEFLVLRNTDLGRTVDLYSSLFGKILGTEAIDLQKTF